MNDRSLFILLICMLGAISGAIGGRAQAAPLAAGATAISAQIPFLMKKIGQGCGWDYPCPPVPDYGRRFYQRSGDIYIHNNYGPVNVYTHGRRPAEETGRPLEGRPCETGSEGGGACVERRNCAGYPCDENCGALCWMRRFKKGYCGHGCWAYLEQSRAAAEEKAARREDRREQREAREEDLPGCDGRECPPPRYQRPWQEEAQRWHEHPRYERAPQDSLTPREPFVGPHYRGTCADGSC